MTTHSTDDGDPRMGATTIVKGGGCDGVEGSGAAETATHGTDGGDDPRTTATKDFCDEFGCFSLAQAMPEELGPNWVV
ncbi:hypothetical protein Droror1_Dr00023560 [Drosera rotundifolia]